MTNINRRDLLGFGAFAILDVVVGAIGWRAFLEESKTTDEQARAFADTNFLFQSKSASQLANDLAQSFEKIEIPEQDKRGYVNASMALAKIFANDSAPLTANQLNIATKAFSKIYQGVCAYSTNYDHNHIDIATKREMVAAAQNLSIKMAQREISDDASITVRARLDYKKLTNNANNMSSLVVRRNSIGLY